MHVEMTAFDRRDLQGVAIVYPAFIVLSLIAYLGLTISFDFPDILRRDATEILAAFSAHEVAVRSFYYVFALAHLVLAAGVLIAHRALRQGDGPWLLVATAGGVLYGIAQTAGFLRWPLLVPVFSEAINQPDLSPQARELALLTLSAFHQYAGVAIGENLSFWGMCAWLVGTGIALMQIGRRSFGYLWIGTGCMVGAYTFEQLGGPFASLAPLLLISHGMAYGLLLALSWSFAKTRADRPTFAPVGRLASLLIALFCALLILHGVWP
jgi:hypothetical protein